MPVSDATPVAQRLTLRALPPKAHLNDDGDDAPYPQGVHDCIMMSWIIPSALAVLRAAAEIEPDPERVLDWYRYTPISELGSLTAKQLVWAGCASIVIDFLQSIGCGRRD